MRGFDILTLQPDGMKRGPMILRTPTRATTARQARTADAEPIEPRRLLSAGTVHAFVYADLNASGAFDNTDTALPGAAVYADLNHNGSPDADEPSAAADANGNAGLMLEVGPYY